MGKKIIIYHEPCLDGFGAAFASHLLSDEGVELVAAQTWNPPPTIPRGADVLIADISFDVETMVKMRSRASRLVLLDHHESARKRLAGSEQDIADDVVLSERESGCVLTYKYLHPDAEEVPEFFLRIQDQDLWRWEYPDNEAFIEGLSSLPLTLQAWEDAYFEGVAAIIERGKPMVEFRNKMISEIADDGIFAARFPTPDGFVVAPAVTAPRMIRNHMTRELLRRFPEAPFGAIYTDKEDGTRTWSLRSDENRAGVLEIAEMMKGGGHRNAAGCTEDHPGQHVSISGSYADYVQSRSLRIAR